LFFEVCGVEVESLAFLFSGKQCFAAWRKEIIPKKTNRLFSERQADLNEVVHSKNAVAKHGSRSRAALERKARPAVRTQSLSAIEMKPNGV